MDRDVRYRSTGLQLVVSLLLAAVAIAALEHWLRAAGGRPFSRSDAAWYEVERRVEPDDLLLLGSSRILTGIEVEALERGTGRGVRQLALTNGSAIVMLEHVLAKFPDFRGLVVADLAPAVDFGGEADGRTHDAIAWRSTLGPGTYAEERLQDALDQRLALRNWALAPSVLLRVPGHPNQDLFVLQLGEHSLPSRQLVYPFEEYSPAQLERYAQLGLRGVGEAAKPEVFAARLERLARGVAELHARGGQVVLLRMPSSGAVEAWEDEHFPRADYWDEVAAIPGVVALHFRDVPGLRLTPPDGSHMSREQARRYTSVLIAELDRRGLLARRSR